MIFFWFSAGAGKSQDFRPDEELHSQRGAVWPSPEPFSRTYQGFYYNDSFVIVVLN